VTGISTYALCAPGCWECPQTNNIDFNALAGGARL
jgi:hypothetical protein